MRQRIESLEQFRALQADYMAARDAEKRKILVCCGTGCVAGGNLNVYHELKKRMDELGIPCEVSLTEHHADAIGLKKSGCHGFCEMGPLVHIEPMGVMYIHVKPEDCHEILEKTVLGGEVIDRLVYHLDGTAYPKQEDIPFYKKQHRVVLENCGTSDAEDIEEYIAKGGYSGFERALFEMTDEQICRDIIDSGLRGRGGAGFPTDVKLQPKQSVDTLLINASECEVWLTSDTQEMLECSDDIIRGIKAVLQYTGIPKCIIGIENNKPECIDLLCKKTKDDSAIEVKPLPSVYGTGAELILIEKCLGREVPHGGLPADAGAIVMNVTSVSTLGKYLATGMPVVQRTITVDGDACAKPQNVVVPVGTAYQDILDYVGVKGELGKVVAGGAMMGPAVENLSYPTTKTTSGLILLSKAAAQPAQVNPCIRCGRCVEYCPMGLEPVEVNQAYAARDVQELGKLHADYCFNCGSCSFVCPAKRPVTQMMSLAKAFYLGEIKKGGNK